jgi:hypothetical protein
VLLPLLYIILLGALAVVFWLTWSTHQEVKQLRSELDETQRQVNELKAAAEVVPAPPPLPRTRSAGLEDLREQLRAAHREEGSETE